MYVEDAPKVKEEEIVAEFGFHPNRPFYLRSRMPFKRVIGMHGNAHLYFYRGKTNNKAHQFWFDPVSKTIRNNNWKGHAITIPSNGNSRGHMRMTGVTSRWW
jgi:hypothetical protein